MEFVLVGKGRHMTMLVVSVLMALLVIPCFASNTEQFQDESWLCGVRGVPFPDEEINRYVGQVIDPSIILELTLLVEERYPGHCTSIEGKTVEGETIETIYRGEKTTFIHFHKILLISFLDHGVIGPGGEVLEPPVAEQTRSKFSSEQVKPLSGPYPYSGTLTSGSWKIHNKHYLAGTYEFESHTSWTPSYANMGIGL
ncbi:MAG: hypothetical protein JRI56_04680 [Deltaproteobacteria bacterium]|nr:hypothetical protein [Deltaproteobacteria bacterium]